MKTLQVSNGDLVLDTGGRLQFLQGTSKLVQDLTLWLQEPISTGFSTPNFGSILPGLIGSEINQATIATVQAEVQRILSLYQTQQVLSLKTAQNLSQLGYWNKSEIINSITTVKAYQNYTAIVVEVTLTTLTNGQLSLQLYIDSNGIQVQNNG